MSASAEPTGLAGPEGLEPPSRLHPSDGIPRAAETAAKCLWCEGYYTTVDAEGLCDMCREPAPEPQKAFDTSVITERLNEIDARFLEPLIRKAADNFYCQVLDSVDDYLLENLDHNMSSHIKMLERENQRMRTELWEVDRTLGCLSLGHETRLNHIKELEARHNQATAECWRLRGELASAIEARRAETSGSVEDESAVPNGETPK